MSPRGEQIQPPPSVSASWNLLPHPVLRHRFSAGYPCRCVPPSLSPRRLQRRLGVVHAASTYYDLVLLGVGTGSHRIGHEAFHFFEALLRRRTSANARRTGGRAGCPRIAASPEQTLDRRPFIADDAYRSALERHGGLWNGATDGGMHVTVPPMAMPQGESHEHAA